MVLLFGVVFLYWNLGLGLTGVPKVTRTENLTDQDCQGFLRRPSASPTRGPLRTSLEDGVEVSGRSVELFGEPDDQG